MKLKDISEDDVHDIADTTAIIARGLDYYETGQIKSFRVENNRIIAKVSGNFGEYDTEVTIKDEEIDASCNCPYDGYGCKHIVAVMYKWINEKDGTKVLTKSEEKELDIKKELSKLDKKDLIELFMIFSEQHDDIKRDLSIQLIKGSSKGNFQGRDIILNQIEETLYAERGYIDYYSLPGVMRRLGEIKSAILNCPPESRAYLLDELAKKSLDAIEHSDDSGGDLSMFIRDCLSDLGKALSDLNLPFEKKKKIIVKNLNNYEKKDFGDGYLDLALEILNSKEDFDFLIDELKRRISDQKKDYRKSVYRTALTEVYRRGNKDKEYLEILTENMEKDKEYVPLVEFWKEKDEIKKAVEVAEEGIKHKRNFYSRKYLLYDFLEEIYSSQKKKEDLLRVMILYFNEYPSLSKYKDIKKICGKSKKWKKIRSQLLEKADNNTRIEIHLFENELENAYDELMKDPSSHRDTFKDKVAKALLDKYPEKSLKVYLSLVKEFIEMKEREGYRIAAMYARNVKHILIEKLDDRTRWNKYISRIREQNRRRPALIDEFRRL